jgi:hypothetical protein
MKLSKDEDYFDLERVRVEIERLQILEKLIE